MIRTPFALALLALALSATAQDDGRYLVLHDLGWAYAKPKLMRERKAYLDTLPCDGIAVYLDDDAGNDLSWSQLLRPQPVSRATIAAVLAPVAGWSGGNLRRNFGLIYMPRGCPDAWDDAAWAVMAQNLANLGVELRAAGLVGVFFDNENYNDYGDWRPGGPVADASRHSLVESQAQMRARGEQLMRALQSGFPEVEILFFHDAMVSDETFYERFPRYNNVAFANELVGPFEVGFVGAKNATAQAIEGGEYDFGSKLPAEFRALYDYQKVGIVAPAPTDTRSRASGGNGYIPNAIRAAWPGLVSAGAAVYAPENRDANGDPTTVADTIANAMATVDRYAWLYMEVPGGNPPPHTSMLEAPGTSLHAATQAWVDAVRDGWRRGKATPPPPGVTWVSDLTPLSAINGWGPMERDRSNGETGAADRRPLTLAGVVYAKGLGVHAASDIVYDLGGRYAEFTADVGVDDEVGDRGSVEFRVLVDGTQRYGSGVVTGATATRRVAVDVRGATRLRLVVTDAGDGRAYDHADWAAAALSPATVTVSGLAWTAITNGWGPVERDRSNGEQVAGDGHPLTIGGTTFARGLGVHAPSDVRVPLAGRYATFSAAIGIDDEVGARGTVVFRVYVDGSLRYASGVLTGAMAALPISVDVSGGSELRLVVDGTADGLEYDHADWADARLTPAAPAPAAPTSPG